MKPLQSTIAFQIDTTNKLNLLTWEILRYSCKIIFEAGFALYNAVY